MAESDPPAQFPEADGGGGRSGRGPATHVPGETEPGGVVPPYEGRKESGEIDGEDLSGPKTVHGLTSPEPTSTPGGRDASPADEQPAEVSDEDEPADPGVGPDHIKGTTRGEDISSGEAHQPDDERPAGSPEPEDLTGVDAREPSTDTPFERGEKDA